MTAAMNVSQQQQALGRANQIRSKNAALKVEIRAAGSNGRTLVARLLANPEGAIGSLTIEKLLTAIDGCGTTKARNILTVAGVPPYWRVGRLTSHQRDRIIEKLLR